MIGKTRPEHAALEVGKGEVRVWRDTKTVFKAKLQDLHQVWDSVSWKICQQRDNPAGADQEHSGVGDPLNPGLHVFVPDAALSADLLGVKTGGGSPVLMLTKPKIAILREQGVN